MEKIRFASVIVTYRCNARCHMCNTWQFPTEPAEEITPEVIDRLPNIPSINVTGGEPFLRSDLEDIIAVLSRKAQRIVISTNGYWTDRILSVAEKYPHLGFRVSIEGLPKANDELRGIKDGFDHGIRTLTGLRERGVKDIGFGITLSDRNAKDMMSLYHLARMMGVEFATAALHNSFYFHKDDNRFERPDEVSAELNRLVDEFLKSTRPKDWFRAYFNHGLANYVQGKPRLLPCRMAHHAFFLDPFGRILPCNVMEEPLGNLKEQTFEAIWNGTRAAEVRAKVRHCDKNCWMVGSVAEAMKQDIWTPLKWVIGRKWFSKHEQRP